MARRISNRRYPERICKNPECGTTFEPHDRRQLYCEEQCRINANNDKRHFEENSRFRDGKQTRVNNQILNSIWQVLMDEKLKMVSKERLEWLGFNFDSQARHMKNNQTGRRILWYYDYGLEPVDKYGNIFEIHKTS